MTTIKLYTDLKQSEKLMEFLPLESADTCYPLPCEDRDKPLLEQNGLGSTPCWSLAALLDVLPSNKNVVTTVSRGGWQMEPIDYLPNVWFCEYEDDENLTGFNVSADNPVDACYEMILKLHEQNLL